MKKRNLLILVLAVLLCTSFFVLNVSADVKVKNTEWEGKGRVEIHFTESICSSGVKVSVRDSAGKELSTSIAERKENEIELSVKGLKHGEKYKYRIQGIRQKGVSGTKTVKGTFTVPEKIHGITMKETDYEKDKKIVSFEFVEEVEWKNPTVSIMYGNREYVLKNKSRSNKEIEVKVSKLKTGRTYQWKISGIRKKGKSKYVSISGTFEAA